MKYSSTDKILVLCKCSKKVNLFNYDTEVSFWMDKRIEELKSLGFTIFINSISEEDNEQALIPCYNIKDCPLKTGFNHKPGKVQIGIDESGSCNCV